MNTTRFAAVILVALSMTGCAMFGWGESEPAAATPAATAAPAEAAPAVAPAAKPTKKKSKKAAATTAK